MNTYEICVSIGAPDDTKEISLIFKENRFSELISVRYKSEKFVNDKIILTFSVSQDALMKKVLQISKKRYSDVEKRTNELIKNEESPHSSKEHKTWEVIETISLKNKWLVFLQATKVVR